MRPEILAPAGDETSMRAAVRAGADAVYFGLQGFNARARAANFTIEGLAQTMADLHAHGVKGYVALNTLVFDHELLALEAVVRACAAAGVDAVIVQDLGTAQVVRAIAPTLHVHASTQMTCTDAASVSFAASMGAKRVVLARELSLDEIGRIKAAVDTELEIFVHGALCVSYSGQCLTSEAIGGRSANRGACAQACRLPYDLIVDGAVHDTGDRAYLLSPQDLESSERVPQMAALGISSLKIEGRLKGPEYVASVTKLYRAAVDGDDDVPARRREALVTFSRGSGPGFLQGVDHQRLVEARSCEHRGVLAGTVDAVVESRGKPMLQMVLAEALSRGDGLVVEGGRAGAGERGGRVWDLVVDDTARAQAAAGARALVWLGPDTDVRKVAPGRRVFLNDEPKVEKKVLHEVERDPHREPIDVVVAGALGAPFTVSATSDTGLRASVTGDAPVEAARDRPIDDGTLRDKLGRLGDTPFSLRGLVSALPAGSTVPLSALNRARRALTDALIASAARAHATTSVTVEELLAAAAPRTKAPPPAGLFVLCRSEAQARAALAAGADGVYLDFLALTGTGNALKALRAEGAKFVGVAPPRIRKPGEEKIDAFLASLQPDAVLVRGLGALHEGATSVSTGAVGGPLRIGDFSLNVTNRLAATEVLSRNLDAFTPSFDLDAFQLTALLATGLGPWAELVVHHPMPLFHTEHCVFAAMLSDGKDFRDCGRPCERHTISLRDRVGLDNPVEADVGCRNTVFHAQAQSAAATVPQALQAGARRFRIELVREPAVEVARIVQAYRALLDGKSAPQQVFKALKTEGGYGVVRGSLRVLS